MSIDRFIRRVGATFLIALLMSCVVYAGQPKLEPIPEPDGFDFVFFGADRPVFLRVVIDTGRLDVAASRDALAQEFFTTADGDGDGWLSADEPVNLLKNITTHLFADDPQRANAANLQAMWKTWDRSPTDEKLSPDEVATGLSDELGPLVKITRKPKSLVQNVGLHRKLDEDNDGHVDLPAMSAGLKTLHQFDFDDDESLSVAELQPFPQNQLVVQPNPMPAGDDDAPLPLEHLSRGRNLAEIAMRIMRDYGGLPEVAAQQSVPVDRLRLATEATERLDLNGDEQFDVDELTRYLRDPVPQVVVEARLENRRSDQIDVVAADPTSAVLDVLPESSSKWARTSLAGLNTEFRLINAGAAGSDNVNFFKLQVRVADGDKNGYLDEAEFAALGLPNATFDAVDADGDKQVFAKEVGSFVQQRNRLSRCQIQLVIVDTAKTLFELIDENQDRRLTPREFLDAANKVAPYDGNHDERLATRELVASYQLRFSMGAANILPDRDFAAPANQAMLPLVTRRNSGPVWHSKMDRNADGDLTWREFLGPKETFDRLDTNHDGFIDETEAVATDAQRADGT